MTELDLGNLRPWLDEQEQYARTILPMDPAHALAQEMLTAINEARASFKPSADSTANYVSNKDIVEQLGALRAKAENITQGKGKERN